jgi:hypothetical protein
LNKKGNVTILREKIYSHEKGEKKMKTKIMIYIGLILLFVYAGNTSASTEGSSNNYFGTGAWGAGGSSNSFFGASAGGSNTSSNNTFIGFNAGYSNTYGDSNTFSGHKAGYFNTMGYYNTFNGVFAGFNNTTGYENTFIGGEAGYSNTTGGYNTFNGDRAGYSNTTGSGNVFLGYNAGYNETGSNKLYISNSSSSTPLIYGEFDNGFIDVNGDLYITGNTYVDSDRSLKRDIQPIDSSLNKILLIEGITFKWKRDGGAQAGRIMG